MQTGYLMLFQNGHEGLADVEMVKKEMQLAELTEECGFDVCWSAEHHFSSYSMIPDNVQTLTWLAARTTKIKLGTGAVILPWNQPIRVAEKISMLDTLCDGRLLFGIGRGLARREYEAFGVDMEESRERFNEAAPMIFNSLQTGFIEGDGPFYPQKRTEIRPRPSRSFDGRFYGVAMSPDTIPVVAGLGASMYFFVQFPIEAHIPGVEHYRGEFQKAHNRVAPPPVVADVVYCDKDAGHAEEMSRHYAANYYLSVLEHYEFLADYHHKTKGYEVYGNAAKILKAAGKEKSLEDFVDVQACGTPQQILDKLEKRRDLLGEFEWLTMLSYAGLPFDAVEKSMRLLGKEVLPEVRSWETQDAA